MKLKQHYFDIVAILVSTFDYFWFFVFFLNAEAGALWEGANFQNNFQNKVQNNFVDNFVNNFANNFVNNFVDNFRSVGWSSRHELSRCSRHES